MRQQQQVAMRRPEMAHLACQVAELVRSVNRAWQVLLTPVTLTRLTRTRTEIGPTGRVVPRRTSEQRHQRPALGNQLQSNHVMWLAIIGNQSSSNYNHQFVVPFQSYSNHNQFDNETKYIWLILSLFHYKKICLLQLLRN